MIHWIVQNCSQCLCLIYIVLQKSSKTYAIVIEIGGTIFCFRRQLKKLINTFNGTDQHTLNSWNENIVWAFYRNEWAQSHAYKVGSIVTGITDNIIDHHYIQSSAALQVQIFMVRPLLNYCKE